MRGADIDASWGVLEIGPGIGCLTYELAQHAGRVAAVEIDAALLPILEQTLPFDNVHVVHADFMKLDLADWVCPVSYTHLVGVVIQPRQNADLVVWRTFKAALPLLCLPQKRGHGKAKLSFPFGQKPQILNSAGRGLRRHAHALEILAPKGGQRPAKGIERPRRGCR